MIITREIILDYLNELSKLKLNDVLDVGSGKGRFSIPLLKRGLNVTGIDINNSEINHKNFNFIKKDIREFDFNKKYDLIICSLILHFFKKEKAIEIINKLKDNTSESGINFLVCMSNEDELYKEKLENFYPTLVELKKLYIGWEIIKELQDFTEIEQHDNLLLHRHNLIFLIARKI